MLSMGFSEDVTKIVDSSAESGHLTPVQAVHLAMLAPAPRRFAVEMADGKPSVQWMAELRDHLRRMKRAGYMGPEQLARAMRGNLRLLDRR